MTIILQRTTFRKYLTRSHKKQDLYRFFPLCRQTTFHLKEQEKASRLALSFVVHGQPGLFEILLHLMFRPWHSYCIYIDAKTREKTRKAFQSIVNCYQEIFPWTNIFLVQSPEKISWGTYSLLNADLTCLEQLLSVDK